MLTAAAIYWVLNGLSLTVNIRNVCVLLAPFFASLTSMVAYLMASEVRDEATGLLAAALIAIVPGTCCLCVSLYLLVIPPLLSASTHVDTNVGCVFLVRCVCRLHLALGGWLLR